jgi:hypothetical protein
MVVKKLEEEVALLLLVTQDSARKLWVDKEGFLACCRVRSDEWVNGCDCIATDYASPVLAVIGLLDGCEIDQSSSPRINGALTGMDDLKAVKSLAKFWRQPPICLSLVGE